MKIKVYRRHTLGIKEVLLSILLSCSFSLSAQLSNTYQSAYGFIDNMLTGEVPLSFKNAVFATENAFYDEKLDMDDLNRELKSLIQLMKDISSAELITYTGKDKDFVTKHAALFKVLTDMFLMHLSLR
jgi:hypothetical protein